MNKLLHRLRSDSVADPLSPRSSRPARRRTLGLALAATLALGGAGVATASAAHATPLPQQTEPGTPSAEVAAGVVTHTELIVQSTPSRVGQYLVAAALVSLDGPALLNGEALVFELDGVVVGQSPLLYFGSGKYGTLVPLIFTPGAGSHELVARFAGTGDALASASDPAVFSVAQISTLTEITSAPISGTIDAPIDVSARVSADQPPPNLEGLDGSAALLANGSPVMTIELAADGSVRFDDVLVPWGTTTLSVAYLGDTRGNYAPSSSAFSPFAGEVIDTTTALSLSAPQIRADGAVALTATVQSADGATAPRGTVEFQVDGEVVRTAQLGTGADTVPGTALAVSTLNPAELMLGEHELTARLVPADGFAGSSSAAAALRILGVETVLTPHATEVRGTPTWPAQVDVTAQIVDGGTDDGGSGDGDETGSAAAAHRSDAPIDLPAGTVQAYLSAKPLGDPVSLENGTGTVFLAGLPVGTHEVELRFAPGSPQLLRSAATVAVTVTADTHPDDGGTPDDGRPDDGVTPDGSTQPKPHAKPGQATAHPGALATTGGAAATPLLRGGLALLCGSAALIMSARRRS